MSNEIDIPEITENVCPTCNQPLHVVRWEDEKEKKVDFKMRLLEFNYSSEGTVQQYFVLRYCNECRKVFSKRRVRDFAVEQIGVLTKRKQKRETWMDRYIPAEVKREEETTKF